MAELIAQLQQFIANFDFTDVAQIKLLISKLLGYTIIAGATFVKVPQIIKIVKARSVAGLSFTMYLLELVCFTIGVSYNYRNGFPFSSYGEYYPMIIQNLILLHLIRSYTNKSSLFTALAVGGYAFLLNAMMTTDVLPMSYLGGLQLATIPINAISRIPQIITNFKNKNTGQLSVITWFMNFGGSSARVFTTLQQVDDKIILLGYIIAAVLNGVILAQIVLLGGAPAIKPKAAAGTSGASATSATTPRKSKKQQ